MQQSDKPPVKTATNPHAGIRPSRLIKHPHQFLSTEKWSTQKAPEELDVAALPTAIIPAVPASSVHYAEQVQDAFDSDPDADIPLDVLDVGSMNTVRLMQLSGVMRAVRPPQSGTPTQGYGPTAVTGALAQVLQQNLPLTPQPDGTRYNSYPPEIFGKTRPLGSAEETAQAVQNAQPAWKALLNKPFVRYTLGILLGAALILLVSRGIDFHKSFAIVKNAVSSMQGITYILCGAAAFIAAFSTRGIRWSFFLRPIKRVNPFTTIRIFWIAVFMNFLLPVQGGEVIKTFLLKRTDGVPISQSLPTVAMDKSLDLMPALLLMSIVPFIPGIQMSLPLWLILGFVSSILLGVIFTVTLTALNRNIAIKFIQLMLKPVPKGIGAKIEGFAFGFVDSLLAGASQPKTFIPAILLTLVALAFDGLFAWMCFLAAGLSNMSYGAASFGYTLFNMFTIIPSPPGQLGSNETYGPLVFSGLLHFDKSKVLAMFLLSHPLAAIVMTILCFVCLNSLGISFSSVMKASPTEGEHVKNSSAQAASKVASPQRQAYPVNQGEFVGSGQRR